VDSKDSKAEPAGNCEIKVESLLPGVAILPAGVHIEPKMPGQLAQWKCTCMLPTTFAHALRSNPLCFHRLVFLQFCFVLQAMIQGR
jgi:hypothetical protein